MTKAMNYGPRFNGSSARHEEPDLNYNRRAKIKSPWAPGGTAWWTQERREKLRICMNAYDDFLSCLHKAQRVFPNVTDSMIRAQWNRMEKQFRNEEDNYESWINAGNGNESS